MDANRIKINYNVADKTASFQFLSDNGQWTDVHKGSDLSRKKCTTAIAEGRIDELFRTIDKIYNIGGYGVIISFSGDAEIYSQLLSVSRNFDGISLERKEVKSVIIGKRNAGKTCLAEGIMAGLGSNPTIDDKDDYISYVASDYGLSLFEIKGIDLGLENVNKAYTSLVRCVDAGATTIFYCFLAKTGKIETVEIDFIHRFEKEHPRIKVKPIITGCVDERKAFEFAQRIVEEIGDREVLITLARDMNTKAGIIPHFGIDQVIKNLSGGDV